MKALSLLQPWASLIVMGVKTIETRSWTTAYRGPLLIHASLRRSGAAFAVVPPFNKYIADYEALPRGYIIGEVNLVDVMRVEMLPISTDSLRSRTLEENAFGDFTKGRWAWILEDAVAWDEVVPATGKLGLWDF